MIEGLSLDQDVWKMKKKMIIAVLFAANVLHFGSACMVSISSQRLLKYLFRSSAFLVHIRCCFPINDPTGAVVISCLHLFMSLGTLTPKLIRMVDFGQR